MTLPSTTANTVRVIAEVEDARSRLGTFWFSMARIFLLATLLAAPLAFGAVQTWAWTSLVFLALFLLVLWAVGSLRRGVLRIAWSPLYLPAALFLLLVMLQFYGRLTLDPFATRESLLKLGTDLILFFLARQLLWEGRKGPWQNFGLTIAIYAFSLSLFAIFQFFSSGGLIYWVVRTTGWTFGPYVNHNHYAGLMEMLIPIALAFVLSRQEGYPARVMLWFAVAVPIASVLLSGSRGGLVSLLAEIAILGAILVRHAPRRGGRSSVKLWGLGIAAAVLLFFWMDPGNISKHLATVANLTQPSEATFGERTVVARDTLRILRDSPWLGAGLGSFETAYPPYRSFPSDLVWDHAHNDYAEALAETGLIGGALILVSLVIFLRLAFGNLRERLKHESGWIQLGAAIGCCGLLVHSFFDFNLHIPANAAWFAVCAGAASGNTDLLPRGR